MERVFNVNYLFHRTHVIYFCDRQKHTLSYTISYGSNFMRVRVLHSARILHNRQSPHTSNLFVGMWALVCDCLFLERKVVLLTCSL